MDFAGVLGFFGISDIGNTKEGWVRVRKWNIF